MTPSANTECYKNHRFPAEIISHGVWLYYRFTLSYRDVQELLFERRCGQVRQAGKIAYHGRNMRMAMTPHNLDSTLMN